MVATQIQSLTCPSSALKKALAFIAPAILANPILPILECALLTVTDGRLTITGSDLTLTLSAVVPVECEGEFTACVPHKTIKSLIDTLPEQPVTFRASDKLTIKTANGTFNIATDPAIDYPKPPATENGNVYTLSFTSEERAVFADRLTRCLFAVAAPNKSLDRFEGVNWRGGELTTSDGHRLARMQDIAHAASSNVLIPTRTAWVIARAAKASDGAMHITVSDRSVQCKLDDYVIEGPLKEERFPDYEMSFPTSHNWTFQVGRNDLIGAIRRALLMSNSATNRLELAFGENGLMVSSQDIDLSQQGSEWLTIDGYNGEPFEFSVDGKLLVECLINLNGDQLTMQFTAPNRPAIMFCDTETERMLLAPRYPEA